jgi:hypothetical protein
VATRHSRSAGTRYRFGARAALSLPSADSCELDDEQHSGDAPPLRMGRDSAPTEPDRSGYTENRMRTLLMYASWVVTGLLSSFVLTFSILSITGSHSLAVFLGLWSGVLLALVAVVIVGRRARQS